MKNILTSKQQKCWELIREYITEKEISPTVKELATMLGVKSTRSVTQYLETLERKGYIMREKHSGRGIRLPEQVHGTDYTKTVQVPVVAYAGCDDLSVFENQTYDEYIPVEYGLIQNKRMLAVRAIGESMNEAGIEDGDYVLIEKTPDVNSGENVVAIIDGMITIKHLERRADATILWPKSRNKEKYKPIVLRPDFPVLGRVVMVIPIIEHERVEYTSDMDS